MFDYFDDIKLWYYLFLTENILYICGVKIRYMYDCM